jgi:hypothetical protein
MSVISLSIHVDDLDSVLALFNKIQVWRSATELGTYSEITSASDTPAQIDGSITGPWVVSSQTLTIVLNSADPINITFTGTNPLNLATVIQKINTVIPGFASEKPTNTNLLRLTSPVVGTGSAITLSGNACATLGLSTVKVNGKQARISLVSPTTEYLFKDYDGDSNFWYKTRYYATVTQAISSFSDPRQGNPQIVLPDAALVTGSIHLADASGEPVVGRRIIFVPITPMLVPSSPYGILPGFDRIIAQTDEAGNASVNLAIGMQVKVFFEGSAFNREFTVPDVDFDVLQVATAQPDTLNIVVAPPMPIRVS